MKSKFILSAFSSLVLTAATLSAVAAPAVKAFDPNTLIKDGIRPFLCVAKGTVSVPSEHFSGDTAKTSVIWADDVRTAKVTFLNSMSFEFVTTKNRGKLPSQVKLDGNVMVSFSSDGIGSPQGTILTSVDCK